MSLSTFEFPESINKLENNISEIFYIPCMKNSVSYDRISGYFGSTIYLLAWDALKDFINNGGHMRILCSPFISDEDADAIVEGNEAKMDDVILASLKEELDAMMQLDSLHNPYKLLACLISMNIIEIKLVVGYEASNPEVKQLFHDKVGLFKDAENNIVAFRGSMNETYKGLVEVGNSGNIESADIFQSWDGGKDAKRIENSQRIFNKIWEEEYSSLEIYELPQEIRQKLKRDSNNEKWEELIDEVTVGFSEKEKWMPKDNPTKKVLRDHQFNALESWEKNNYRGIFEHATGSGKTITALCAIRNAIKRNKSVLILVPSLDLLNQWERELNSELSDLDIKLLLCGTGHTSWKKEGVLNAWTSKSNQQNVVTIATMDTAASDYFIREVNAGDHLLVVADEVHRLGSERRRSFFELNIGERLGVSATPIRFGDSEGTAAILNYFGGILEPVYTLEDAIKKDGVLTKYFYYPKMIKLLPEEQERWDELTGKIAKCYAIMMSQEDADVGRNEKIKKLELERARLIKKASAKIQLAYTTIKENYKSGQKWIVYCEDITQLKDVLDALKSEFDAYEYHSQMTGDRAETLKYFSRNGGILVSIKCLDEGVDIPSTTHALILASSKNPREYIQRRGRILRRSPGKNFAYLYDALVIPNEDTVDPSKSSNIIAAELARAIQFGGWSENPTCIADLKNTALEYGIELNTAINAGEEGDLVEDE